MSAIELDEKAIYDAGNKAIDNLIDEYGSSLGSMSNHDLADYLRRIPEAIAGALSTAEALRLVSGVKVKSLEWTEDHGVAHLGPYRLFQADTSLGRFAYGTDAEGNCYWHSQSSGVFMVKDEATAKRQAEASWANMAISEAEKYINIAALTRDEPVPEQPAEQALTDSELSERLKDIASAVFPSANKFAVADGVKRVLTILERVTPAEYLVLHTSLYPPRRDAWRMDDGQPTESQEWADYDRDC